MAVKNNLYFSSLFSEELNLLANNVQKTKTFKLQEIKNSPLFYVDDYSHVYSIIPLFNVSMIEGIDEKGKKVKHLNIISSNPNDIVSDRGIVCEKNSSTKITFK